MQTRLLTCLISLYKHPVRVMSVFVQSINPVTGKTEWEIEDESYDYHQEIARSAYADMLHDTERNEKYQFALEHAIAKMHDQGKKAHVLDIGTGTGLLSMMAARAGADSIIACEAFTPMGACAKDIIRLNGFEDKIKVIPKRSTELTVGPTGDLPHKANILVTEVFDTELIGEGAYPTFSHAHKVLLEKDCIVVPSSATVYAQVVESKLVSGWNDFRPLCCPEGNILVDTPPDVVNCAGAAAVHDIQLSQLPLKTFKTILPPEAVFRFDYSGRTPIIKERSTVQVLKAESDGTAQAVFMWWDLVMDTEGKVLLSCAPFWAHPSGAKSARDIPWRDHWMQAVYYLPKPIPAKKGQELSLISSHDEYSLWFNLGLDLKVKDKDYERPVCTCAGHAALCRTRIGQINDEERTQKYLQALRPVISEQSVCLNLSDSSLIALAAANMGAKKVYCMENNLLTRRVIQNYIAHNKLQDKVVLLDEGSNEETILKQIPDKVTVVLSEPYFLSSILPWENIHFLYLKDKFRPVLADSCITLPSKCTIYGMAVEFVDLWKIRAPLVSTQGFKMKCFDDLIEKSSDLVDTAWEAQPLWEYPCHALSSPVKLLELEFGRGVPSEKLESSGLFDIKGDGKCNGIALWVDWDLDGQVEHTVSTGPTETPQLGRQVKWDIYTRQGVYLIRDSAACSSSIPFSIQFYPSSGSFKFDFNSKNDGVSKYISSVNSA